MEHTVAEANAQSAESRQGIMIEKNSNNSPTGGRESEKGDTYRESRSAFTQQPKV